MRKWKHLLLAMVTTVLLAEVSAAAVGPLALDLGPDESNPSAPVMGATCDSGAPLPTRAQTPLRDWWRGSAR